MNPINHFDLIIVGGGTAGFAAALTANKLQARTMLVNDNAIGFAGTCVNVGCVPTKHLLYIGELLHKIKKHNFKGLKSSVAFDFPTVMEEKDKLVETRRSKDQLIFEGYPNVHFVAGTAIFTSKAEVQVADDRFTADRFIIATGSSTNIPPIEGLSKVKYLTNVEALQLKKLPTSMIIIGGGALGVEFAQMFSRFGTKVYVLQRADRIVPREESGLAHLLMLYLQDEGIEIYTKADVNGVEQEGSEKVVTAIIDGKERSWRAEELLIATGRRPNTAKLGLEKLGVALGRKGEIIVNNEMQATAHVWAAGDVTGEPMLETVAAKEGAIAATNALAKNGIKERMDYNIVPHAVFTDPQLAGVGLTDEQACERGVQCRCTTVSMEHVTKAKLIKDVRGAIKVIIDEETQRIIGVHLLAPQGADLLHEGLMIVKNKMTVDEVAETRHIFPTLSDVTKKAAQALKWDIATMHSCSE
jgi:mercuric reductase